MRYDRYKVIVSNQATKMLVSHAAFLAQVSPPAAKRLIDEFEKVANSLEIMPQRCPRLQAQGSTYLNYRTIIFEKRYMIIFRIEEDTVYADYVVDCRQNHIAFLE